MLLDVEVVVVFDLIVVILLLEGEKVVLVVDVVVLLDVNIDVLLDLIVVVVLLVVQMYCRI